MAQARTKNTENGRRDIREEVTQTVIRQLEAGTVPWRKSWRGGEGPALQIPRNLVTGNRYRGVNVVLLWCAALEKGLPTHEWASFLQWKSKGESVRRGEKGSMVVYFDTVEREDDDGETRKVPFLKASVVFNRSQLASFEPEETPEPEAPSPTFARVAGADAFVAATGAVIEHREGGPCYVPGEDKILMPPPEDFFDTQTCTAGEHYYAALHHELVHWTGSPGRLDRLRSKRFGDAHYATEELVAELGAAFYYPRIYIRSPRSLRANIACCERPRKC